MGYKTLKERDGVRANLLTEKVNPFLYKVWFLEDVLELIEELKLSALKGKAGFMVKPSPAPRRVRHAGFELLVNKYVDIENLLEELGEPHSTIILKRLFLETDSVVMKHLGLESKKEARELVRTSVNRAYSRIRKYMGHEP
ncbi:MAG: hypothetical protein RMH93_06240, partial [Aquificaceae bacterium]|nr:hypothetical protein [Aquificaceae bacterium]